MRVVCTLDVLNCGWPTRLADCGWPTAKQCMMTSSSPFTQEIYDACDRGDAAAVAAWLDGGGRVDALFDSPDGSLRGVNMLMGASSNGDEQPTESKFLRSCWYYKTPKTTAR